MSQGIQERNLPVAESIGEGDKVRIVTSAGNSKNVDASLIGGGGNLVLTETVEDLDASTELHTLSATYDEMMDVVRNGGILTTFSVEPYEQGGVVADYNVQNFLSDGGSQPYHVTASTDEDKPVGYYMESPWEDMGVPRTFYSATSDGAMTYVTGTN